MLICIVYSIFDVNLTFNNSWVSHGACMPHGLGTFPWVLTLQISQLQVHAWTALLLILAHIMGGGFVFPAVTFVTFVWFLRYDVSVICLTSIAVKLIRIGIVALRILRWVIILIILNSQRMICSHWTSSFSVGFYYGFVTFQTKFEVCFRFNAFLGFVWLQWSHTFDIILSSHMTVTQLALTIIIFFNLNHVN